MIYLFTFIFFIILPVFIVWRLSRFVIEGDVQTELLLRGAGAGFCGGLIGATLSSYINGIYGYGILVYLFWLLFTAVFGVIFTFLVAGIEKFIVNLNFPARIVIGTSLGIVTAFLWISTVSKDPHELNWLAKGILCMIAASGIASGIVAGVSEKNS